jgi:hypothetical protein
VASADAYATQAYVTAYWAARSHQTTLAAAWTALATDLKMDGAIREATAYIDATWGPYMRGVRKGFVQGLEWPRTGALDDAGYPLPDLPSCLQAAVAELAARAATAQLAADTDAGARIKRERVDVLETEYFDAGTSAPAMSYGIVAGLLAPILNGSQPSAPNAGWAWV